MTESPSIAVDSENGTRPPGADRTPAQIALGSRSSFLVSFGVLDPERRQGLTTVYAFCRVVDDAADDAETQEQGRAELRFWNDELERAAGAGEPRTPLGRALTDAIPRFGIRPRDLQAVADGVAMDLEETHFHTFEELEDYCYKVACSVGLSCLPVFGASGPDAECYAIALGHALQLTNILRDLRRDAEIGRVYVPDEVLDRYGVDPACLAGQGAPEVYRVGGPMAALTADLAGRAREQFARAEAALPREFQKQLLSAEVMGAVYREILRRLERLGGRVCIARRVRVPRLRKLWIALRVRQRAGRS